MRPASERDAIRPSTILTRSGRTEETDALPVSAVFDVLSDEKRRHVLYYLIEDAGGTAEVSEIADRLRSVGSGSRRTGSEAVLTALHHWHLPRMEDAGLVEYGEDGGAVRYLGDPLVEACLARAAVWDFDRGR